MKTYSLRIKMLTVLGVAATLPSMFGNTITPGTTVTPDVFTSFAGYTQLASTGPVVVNPIPGSSFNATYTEVVVQDANNVYCSGCLDFLIGATNAGPGIFERITTSSFAGFLTDVGYNTAGAAGVTPATIDRSANGAVIGFNFTPPGTSVNAGQNTEVLEIQTNARNFTSGLVSVQDGSSGFGAGFAPSSVPEPASMALLSSGLLLVVGLGKRFRRDQASK